MSEYDLLHGQQIYYPSSEEIMRQQAQCLEKQYDYNATRPSEGEKRAALLQEMFAEVGENCYIEPPLHSNWAAITRIWARTSTRISTSRLWTTPISISATAR